MSHFNGYFRSRAVVPFIFLLSIFFSPPAYSNEVQALKDQIKLMNEQLKAMQERLEKLEQTNQKKEDAINDLKDKTSMIDELDERLNQAELHTATDKISFGVDFRVRADSIHYEDSLVAPASLIAGFFTPVASGGLNGATLAQIQGAMAGMQGVGADKFDVTNDIMFTNRIRLNMKAKVNKHLTFAGRLASYKVWGDSTGVMYNHGSMNQVTMDGNTSSLPHGDSLVVERAYFNLHDQIGEVPFNLSLGRRPSTEGPPLEYRNYSLEGGSPLANVINWQFDGGSLTFNLEDLTDIPGAEFKMCYGVGFEGDWGNSYAMINQPDVDDVHLAGFIVTPYNDDVTSIVLNYAHAWDITDGFTGLTVMPFTVSKEDRDGDGTPEYWFSQNEGGFSSRIQPYTSIGDWDTASLIVRTQIADIDMFVSGALSHTDPSRVSKNPYYEMMGQGLLSSNGNLESHTGYAFWAGALFPMPLDGRLGLEYNWGSKYWFPFTGAEDTLIASKAAARGSVIEAYYIQPIYDDNFFLQLGGQYYNYRYTGSGNPLGKPVKISDANALDTMNQVIDEVWALYLSTTLRF